MAGLFDIILRASAYGTVVGLVILLARGILRNRMSAKWQYLIWSVLILKLVIPFGPGSFISLFNIVPEMPEKSMPQVYYNAVQISEVQIVDENPQIYGASPNQKLNIDDSQDFMRDIVPYIWAAGVISMLLWLIFTYFLFCRKLRMSAIPADERLCGIFQSCKRKMGIDADISLLVQESVGTPSLFGITRPIILMPVDVIKLSDSELEYILLHELAHYRRCDVAANYLLLALQAIHWFNPIVWYCFRCMRRDMEMATDERVLSVLENHEHKAYGRALLAVLEGFTPPRLAPKLLGMVDDRENMTRRIRMIAFFKKPKFAWSIIAAAVIIILGAVCLTGAEDRKSSVPQSQYDAGKLYKYKNQYIGNASNVGNLTLALPLGEYRNGISLKTSSKPYGLTVNYTLPEEMFDENKIAMLDDALQANAVIIFSLIDNVDEITFALNDGKGLYNYSRKMLDNLFAGDVREYSKDIDTFSKFLRNNAFRVLVFPEKYGVFMSSTPGIRILAEYPGFIQKVRYTAAKGSLFIWDQTTGNISERGSILELQYDTPAYWSPGAESGQNSSGEYSVVAVELIGENGRVIAEKEVTIGFDGTFYTVKPSNGIVIGIKSYPEYQKPESLDEVVSQAIKSRSSSYRDGELSTEGHIILDTAEKEG